jgi:hypothetical protein
MQGVMAHLRHAARLSWNACLDNTTRVAGEVVVWIDRVSMPSWLCASVAVQDLCVGHRISGPFRRDDE